MKIVIVRTDIKGFFERFCSLGNPRWVASFQHAKLYEDSKEAIKDCNKLIKDGWPVRIENSDQYSEK